ncbi:MAG: DoxX family membrane protein [Bacteroidota bacterium]
MSNQFILSFAFEAMWQVIVPWFAEHILGLEEPITVFTNGSGDTLYNYLSILCYAIVSGIATIIWSSLDARRPNYEKLMEWVIILIRYYIVYEMIMYGLAKVFYMQFQPPRFGRLIQDYGDSSPMGLMWTFMGFSKGYTIFAGVGELIGGLLLLFRRTTTLGALIVFGVMFNVMMMNFCYDIPVKLLSSHLVLLSGLLIALDGKRLFRTFILNRPTESVPMPPLFKDPVHEKAKIIAKWIIVAIGLGIFLVGSITQLQFMKNRKPLFHGLYEVESFERNGEIIPPLTTDSTRWDKIAIDFKNRASIRTMNGKTRWYSFEPDTTDQTIAYHLTSDTVNVYTLGYSWPDSNQFVLEGITDGDTLRIVTTQKTKDDFLLTNRGFHWVNPYPFNR